MSFIVLTDELIKNRLLKIPQKAKLGYILDGYIFKTFFLCVGTQIGYIQLTLFKEIVSFGIGDIHKSRPHLGERVSEKEDKKLRR